MPAGAGMISARVWVLNVQAGEAWMSEVSGQAMHGEVILVVDDDSEVRDAIRLALELEGYIVHTAKTGAEGGDLAGLVKPDLILMDVLMPAMDAIRANRMLKGNPSTQPIPIILVTVVNQHDEVRNISRLLDCTTPKGIEVELKLVEDLYSVNADPVQIEQVIMNLAVNAKDAMPHGGRLVIPTENTILGEDVVKLSPEASPGRYAVLTVMGY